MYDEFIFGADDTELTAPVSSDAASLELPTFIRTHDRAAPRTLKGDVRGKRIALEVDVWSATTCLEDIVELPLEERIPLIGAKHWETVAGVNPAQSKVFTPTAETPKWFTDLVQQQLCAQLNRGLPWFLTRLLALGINGPANAFLARSPGHALHADLEFHMCVSRTPMLTFSALESCENTEPDPALVAYIGQHQHFLLRAKTQQHHYYRHWDGSQRDIRENVRDALCNVGMIPEFPYENLDVDLYGKRSTRMKLCTQWMSVRPYKAKYRKQAQKRAKNLAAGIKSAMLRQAECYAISPVCMHDLAHAIRELVKSCVSSELSVSNVPYSDRSENWGWCAKNLEKTLRGARVLGVYEHVRRLPAFEKLVKIWRDASPRRRKWITGYSEEQAKWLEYESQRRPPKRIPQPRIVANVTDGYFVPAPKVRKVAKAQPAELVPV